MLPIHQIPNLRHLRALSLTAKYNSVNRAAVEICLSQPAVTQAITKLETEVGESFFERTHLGMYCSEFGRVFLRRVDRALAILEEAAADVASEAMSDPNRIAVRNLTSAQLRAIIAFADHGSYSAAAKILGISLLSMQRTVSALEHAVGAKLFLRSGKGTKLSSAGQRLARGAKLATREIETGIEEIENLRGYKTGRVVVGSMPFARVDIVPQAVTQLLRQYPDLRVRIVDGTYTSLVAGLRSGDIDMIVGALRNPAAYEDVEERPLFEDSLSVVVRAGHPLARYKTLSLAETIGYPWVVPASDTPTRALFEDAFRSRALLEPKRLIEVGSNVSLRAFLVESDHIAFVSARQVSYEEKQGLLAVLPIELPEAHRPIGVMLRQGWEPSGAQIELLRLLEKNSSADTEETKPIETKVKRTRKDIFLARG